ncbi:DNA/RNA nuclease SfsA [Umboniibacter marinipuniceus]|uniref:Sugar fermentation stimulation protein homolog n=1 Tax=Umboniibacter marinipuniceus TaxID=569599 RepID=A0A3M0ABD1_9GAMM|nr:DNA/RNA nuclease SfsA [Umboniibacter marinipuniceus]RMA80078.1 sugar fermentation stimulation protein A [Umboniibacter marinipuniceus]
MSLSSREYLVQMSLTPAVLIRRYKRFLADVELSGELVTVYCPNTGAMTGCGQAGDTVWLSISDKPSRKYRYTWELTETQSGHWICVNPQRANEFLGQALERRLMASHSHYTNCIAEQKYGEEGSRIDFLLQTESKLNGYVEAKSCTLLIQEDGVGAFPDAKSVRAHKHLRELTRLARQGVPTYLVYVVLHSGIRSVRPASEIDPHYALLTTEAIAAGLEVFILPAGIDQKGLFWLEDASNLRLAN